MPYLTYSVTIPFEFVQPLASYQENVQERKQTQKVDKLFHIFIIHIKGLSTLRIHSCCSHHLTLTDCYINSTTFFPLVLLTLCALLLITYHFHNSHYTLLSHKSSRIVDMSNPWTNSHLRACSSWSLRDKGGCWTLLLHHRQVLDLEEIIINSQRTTETHNKHTWHICCKSRPQDNP